MKKSTKTKWVLYFCFLISIWLIAFMAETVVRWNSALVVQVYRCYEGLFGLAPFASQILYLTMKGVVLGGTVALIVL